MILPYRLCHLVAEGNADVYLEASAIPLLLLPKITEEEYYKVKAVKYCLEFYFS